MVQSFIEGESGTVAFFGPSQSGKTYTMHGKAGKERGVVPRAIEEILAIVKNTYDGDDEFANSSSMIEDFGTDTQPMFSVNAQGNRFGLPSKKAFHNGGIQVYDNGSELHRGELDAK